jgi:molybdopterin synthase sulfur carrier subunit
MPTVALRFFAAARDAAGKSSDTVDAATVGDALDQARAAYGPAFAVVLDHARVWLNGDDPPDGAATAVGDGDEIAVLPPVSGG